MTQPIVQVDAFTDQPFAGNPAAVCLLAGPARDDWMQRVAGEMNLSETAFLYPRPDGFSLRWFTPMVEVDLCGHATLASAHVLREAGRVDPNDVVRFHTRSGLLTARYNRDWIELDFPADPARPIDPPPGLLESLGIDSPCYVGRSSADVLIEVESEAALRAVAPDFRRLREIPARGVIVTAPSASSSSDFVSRFFAPAVGIDEDPVTGSAHCCLSPYWADRFGREELVGFQASARGGIVRVRRAGRRVKLGGQAVTVLRGELV